MIMIKRKKVIYLQLIIVLLINIFCFGQNNIHSYAATSGKISEGVTSVNFRTEPNGNIVTDDNGNGIRLNGGQKLTILDTTNSAWYKVAVDYNGTEYTGYVSSQFIEIGSAEESKEEVIEETDISVKDEAPLDDFDALMNAEGFPESYKALLKDIHNIHPTWQFKAVQTGIDWNTLVDNEINKQGQIKNLVYGAPSAPHYNWRSLNVGYNPSSNTWSAYDGTVWFAASDELVKYYMDPRTYLYENYIFVFESLSYQEGAQNKLGVEAILNGSFMYNATPVGESVQYSDIIMDAAENSGVSPYHIASRIKLEMGNSGGVAALGTSSAYPGIFNYFNIGAFDTANGSPVEKGLFWASQTGDYGRPWDSVSKSILGGSQYIGASYIQRGQDTLYTQKFNVTYTGNLFNHQYMTNIQAPTTESQTNYRAYKANNLLDSTMVFKIPVYKNMPENACAKPADSGNPNNWLASLDIKGYTITPSFAVNDVTDYSLIVDSSVEAVEISASPVASTSTVMGTGVVGLSEGTNYINISVTSQTGAVRTYTITVVRGDASAGQTTVNGSDTTASDGDGSLGLKGDINGDGKISVLDIVKIQRVIVGLDETDENTAFLCDLNGDGNVTVLDIVKLQRHIVGIEEIE
ncbi:MAG: cadherin-like beta sandwich domain-containing protein [Lachnospiraceae bacterium]|nr:cadherin-like beta sandwich domain-containing protein [Lachnospiraceae bacterium]